MKLTEAQLRQLIRERMTQFSNKPWLISKVLIAAPAEEGGDFDLEEPVQITEPQHKNILDLLLKMGIPDPDREKLKRKNKEAREKPNPWINPDGSLSDTEYTDEWGRTMTPAKKFKELEVVLAKTPEDRAKIRKKRKEEEEEWLEQNQDEPTRFEERKMKITAGQLKALIREAAKRRPSGWLPATAKNLDLDKPFTADSWITNITGVPVNVLVRNYLKSMGMLEEEDE